MSDVDLYHYTPSANAEGISADRVIKPSEKGKYGNGGVYLTSAKPTDGVPQIVKDTFDDRGGGTRRVEKSDAYFKFKSGDLVVNKVWDGVYLTNGPINLDQTRHEKGTRPQSSSSE